MNTRQRPRSTPARMPAGSDSADSDVLQEARAALEGLARAGQDAIDQALSQNSQQFLASNRQQGGQ